jgi:sigma-B regulation protein RsbU (phosphoserine phosphatase)
MNLVSALFLFALVGATMGYSIHWAEDRLNVEIKRTNSALRERNQALTKLNNELSEAASYVKSMFPEPQKSEKISTEWHHIPCSSLGGDAFGYHWLDNNNFAMYLLDVCGHGVGAALLSVSVLNVIRSESLPKTDFKMPQQVLEALNVSFPGDQNNEMFFTFWYGVYNTSDRTITYASAGHPPALLFGNKSKSIQLKTDNFVIGGMPDISYKQKKHYIDNDASLFVFSDGVYEVEKQNGKMWSFNEYVSLLSELMPNKYKSLKDLYDKIIRINKEDVFEDDYTILKVDFL